MSKGISLHIGINEVSKGHYWKNEVERWDGRLFGCESDAANMEAIAKEQGFQTTILKTKDATRKKVLEHIKQAAKDLVTGDYYFLTYSGHGGQVDDLNEDEKDKKDETFCLYDKQLLDDELAVCWSHFQEGVRIIMVADSCHSGTVSKQIGTELPPGSRLMPKASLSATYNNPINRLFYKGLQKSLGKAPAIKASGLLFSGCEDDQLSKEDNIGTPGGLFTKAIIKAWDWNERAIDNYPDFFKLIETFMEGKPQTPKYSTFGKAKKADPITIPYFKK